MDGEIGLVLLLNIFCKWDLPLLELNYYFGAFVSLPQC